MTICPGCDTAFTPTDHRQKFCGRPCYNQHIQAPTHACVTCGSVYHPGRKDSRFCSLVCAAEQRKRRAPERTCASCAQTYTPHSRHHTSTFCSLECYRRRESHSASKVCDWCMQTFHGERSYIQERRFCSHACTNAWQGRNKDIYTCRICSQPFKWSPSRKKTNPTYCSLKCRDLDPARREQLVRMQALQQALCPNRNEILGCKTLADAGLAFEAQHSFKGKFVVDALLENAPIVIQFDGDYWHGHPDKHPNPDRRQKKRMALDKSQDAYMRTCGYLVVRVWESELQRDPSILITRIQQLLDQHQTPAVVP